MGDCNCTLETCTCRNLDLGTKNLPPISVNAHSENHILILTSGRLQIHLGYLDAVLKEIQETLVL